MIEKINTPIPLPVLNSSPEAAGKSACSGEIKVKGEYNLLGHTNVEAQRILHNSADNGGYGDTDQQAALTFHTTSAMVIIGADRITVGLLKVPRAIEVDSLENYDSGVLKADKKKR